MHWRLNGGIQCCLKGCQNEAGRRKFDSMIGQYEMKCTPEDITSDFEIVKNVQLPHPGHIQIILKSRIYLKILFRQYPVYLILLQHKISKLIYKM